MFSLSNLNPQPPTQNQTQNKKNLSPRQLRRLHARQLLGRVPRQDVRDLVRQHGRELLLGLQDAEQSRVDDDLASLRECFLFLFLFGEVERFSRERKEREREKERD